MGLECARRNRRDRELNGGIRSMATPSGLLLVPLILPLGLDTFAVSTAIGIAPMAPRLRLRFAAACALAEAGMPLVGFVAGGLVGRLGVVADWIAVALLL